MRRMDTEIQSTRCAIALNNHYRQGIIIPSISISVAIIIAIIFGVGVHVFVCVERG